jgi:hypothetical protein
MLGHSLYEDMLVVRWIKLGPKPGPRLLGGFVHKLDRGLRGGSG